MKLWRKIRRAGYPVRDGFALVVIAAMLILVVAVAAQVM